MLTLITGGARSGKSTFAQSLCAAANAVVYLATATESDAEMHARIRRHRENRPSHWQTIEEPIALPETVSQCRAEVILLDCVTLWLSNLLYLWRDEQPADTERKALHSAAALIEASAQTQLIAVTNEVGCGLVPETAVGRLFRDVHGLVNQRLAHAANSVYLLTAGIPLRIK